MSTEKPYRDFIREIIDADMESGKFGGKVMTRFPPEPNGYLHIGHAKSICLNFGVAEEYGGLCNLRFDDSNPETENVDFVEGIKRDIRWLGFDWEDRLYFASDYFDQLYAYALQLVDQGDAYVDSLTGKKCGITGARPRNRAATARTATGRLRKTGTSSNACRPVSFRTARTSCGPGSTWPIPT